MRVVCLRLILDFTLFCFEALFGDNSPEGPCSLKGNTEAKLQRIDKQEGQRSRGDVWVGEICL